MYLSHRKSHQTQCLISKTFFFFFFFFFLTPVFIYFWIPTAGPEIERIINDIEENFVNETLIASDGFGYWRDMYGPCMHLKPRNLLITKQFFFLRLFTSKLWNSCQGIDPTCQTTQDMAMIHWGYYSFFPDALGLNNSEVK